MSSETASEPAVRQVWAWLESVPDPEIPVLSVLDLGIVRDVQWSGRETDECLVTVTPTYSGCPATEVISDDISKALHDHGVRDVRVRIQLAPAWTTDWLRPQAREKLREYGIAPPVGLAANERIVDISRLRASREKPLQIACPRCGSKHTQLTSQFGSTPCKSLYRCLDCLEPFDYFKCH
ncbi:1,2-phenylacetyl-CoA epoxidase subunit PaaD [Hydrocarboniphaga sp.]|jgi:ring-1,2-phenylacetyl-CoA epoxidase subunit PaaD|uniref:1,2-phenylacetyl-CoA epoxidase subunit PaaD n=1 Tax=Hydrocarboniphaga sp. TaxID=2033016 RepID=UPI002ABAEF60|nr:1,2-phenylacetyl-CoA epoxidase subunit PaaD [Hydrocarboniphaga sp.]MDZ4078457.1 1,2-phenylacetyl-CoA epoxidase subunit PaaD [Hydrocarboniphaga sp.]